MYLLDGVFCPPMIDTNLVFKQWISYRSSIDSGDRVVVIPTAMRKPNLEPSVAMATTTAVTKQGEQTTTIMQRMHHFTKNVGGALVLLLPGAKFMRRLHLFGLMNKLVSYEALYEYVENWTCTILMVSFPTT